jgi:hypothetical protein
MPVDVSGIYCGQRDTGFAPRSSVFSYQVWSTNDPHFIACTGLFKMFVGVWPPRSSDATPCDFFLGVYVKDQVYVPLPASIPELKVGIRTVFETITADMLQTVRNELDYRVDVCRITKGAHIEHLYGMSQKHGVLFY